MIERLKSWSNTDPIMPAGYFVRLALERAEGGTERFPMTTFKESANNRQRQVIFPFTCAAFCIDPQGIQSRDSFMPFVCDV